MGYPGMVVFLWSLPGGLAVHRLEHHVEQQVVYSSTHDTDTLAGEMGDVRRLAAPRAVPLVALRRSPCCPCRTCSGSGARRG